MPKPEPRTPNSEPRTPSSELRGVPPALWIFAIALGVRLVHVWQMRGSPFFALLLGDSRGYDEWARRIAGGEWIGSDVFYQAPLYPYMLGVVYAIAGRHLLLVRIVQAVIGAASCALLAVATERFLSRRAETETEAQIVNARHAGIAAGLLLAFYAPAIFFDALIQKSVLDVFFLCAGLSLIGEIALRRDVQLDGARDDARRQARGTRSAARVAVRTAPGDRRLWFALGLAMGALALTRENALVFIAIIGAWTLTIAGGRLKRAMAFAAGLAVLLVPVAARNAYVGGGFYITTSQAGPNFYIGNNPRADGTYQSLRFGRGAPEYERQDATELAERAVGRQLSPGEVSGYWFDRAMDFIASEPGAWLKLMARKAVLVWNATEMVDTESQEAHAEYSLPLTVLGRVGHFGVLVPLAVAGVFVTWPMRRRLTIVYALTLAYAASVVAFYVFARYRYPLVPLLMIFAAGAIVGARRWLAGTSNDARVRVALAATVIVTVVVCNWPMLSAAKMQAVTETNLGVALQEGSRAEDAVVHYRRAIAFSPDYAPAYNNLGSALRGIGRRDEAVAAFRRALELRPDFAGAHYNLANLLMDEGDAPAAVEQFNKALETEPGSADVHNNLGIALAGIGRVDDAIGEFRRAIALDPESPKAYRNLGDALSTRGAQDEALDNLRHAVRLGPSDPAIRYDLASALLEAGLFDDAIREFRETLRLKADFVEAHNNLGIALGSTGRLKEAIEEFRRALVINPHFEDAQRNLSTALRQ